MLERVWCIYTMVASWSAMLQCRKCSRATLHHCGLLPFLKVTRSWSRGSICLCLAVPSQTAAGTCKVSRAELQTTGSSPDHSAAKLDKRSANICRLEESAVVSILAASIATLRSLHQDEAFIAAA
jgi:hypothetical protein